VTPRARLAILYGAVLFAASAVLVAIPNLFAGTKIHAAAPSQASGAEPAATQHVADVHRFLTASLIALGVMLVVSIAFGWFLSGRSLRRRAARAPSTASESNYGPGGRQ
jgi:fructose-specific phosphotransferase system IIC component